MVLDSSTVMTPSLPTFSMASAMTSPTARSRAEMVATWAMSSLPLISFGLRLDRLDGLVDGLLDAVLERHRVGAGGYVAQAFAHDRLGEQGRGGGAVTGDVVGLGGDFLDQLRAHVLEHVFELDLLGDGHAVVGDGRGAELLVEHDVAALGAEGDLDGVGESVDATLERAPSVFVVPQFLSQADSTSSRYSTIARISLTRRISTSSPLVVLYSVPEYLP